MTVETYAFKMKLNDGQRAEYERRHDEIWPELSEALKLAGVINYTIHLDPETNILFAHMVRRIDHTLDALPETALMKKWWAFMADIMETLPNNEPVATPLIPVFEMT